ncbi:hypothetical protein D4764_22G0007130 [Takifugu flavidus]|uniref:Uncharacterized protein n=1 Tax=Takifugu flavidus TaxID=433684 RepID=A0A5C6NDD3_9TELE|nr:hypothetical protein D4764_22G0007130 [Takifugu flavidus]
MEEEEKGSTFTHHSIDVNVEILDYSKGRQESSRTVKPKCARKHHSKRVTTTEDPVGSSLSRASVMSEAAVEELCHLRRYYSSQLRRINYVSHEHLGQPAEPGLLACIWEPLRSLCLGRGPTSGPCDELVTRPGGTCLHPYMPPSRDPKREKAIKKKKT